MGGQPGNMAGTAFGGPWGGTPGAGGIPIVGGTPIGGKPNGGCGPCSGGGC